MKHVERYEYIKLRKMILQQDSIAAASAIAASRADSSNSTGNVTLNLTFTEAMAYAEQTIYGILDGMSTITGGTCNIGLSNLIY